MIGVDLLVLYAALALLAVAGYAAWAAYDATLAAPDLRQPANISQPTQADALRPGAPAYRRAAVALATAGMLGLAGWALTGLIASVALAVVAGALLFVVFGEIVPRAVVRAQGAYWTKRLRGAWHAYESLVLPLAYPLAWCDLKVRQALERPELTQEEKPPEVDLRRLLEESAARGGLMAGQGELIQSIIRLEATHAKEIMVPRINIDALPDTATRAELIELFQRTGRTRIPIFHDNIDTIIGVINVYDILLESPEEGIDRLLKEVMHVPDTVSAADLLQLLKKARYHMAIVTDEYGGTDGLITLEDALEEIFGDIQDEHDRALDLIRQVGPRAYVVQAIMPLEDVSEFIGHPIQDEEVETMGGWVMRNVGRIPAQGEKLKFDGFRVTILEGQSNQINKIRLDILPERFEAKDDEDEKKRVQ
ncbi:MAG: hemolysin family protein [Candidatus Hydrogenedentales bacterium]